MMKTAKNAMRLFTILFSLILVLTLFPAAVTAADGGMSVSFRLIGADADGKYTTWIATKTVTVPAGSMASDLFDLALADANLKPTIISNDWGSYLSAITAPSALGGFTLSEDTVGEWPDAVYAGWMFSVNKRLSDYGMTETPLSSGDSVVFFYAYDMNDGIDWETGDASGAPALAAKDVNPGEDGGRTIWFWLGGGLLIAAALVAVFVIRGKKKV